jgi:hypothetical protein
MGEVEDQAAQVRAEFAAEVTAASTAFDKAVTTLAAGGLALSITFVHDIAPEPVKTGRLAIAWTAFTLTLLFSMASFLTAGYAHRHLIKQLDKGQELTLGGWGVATHILNLLSALGVTAGAAFMAYFAFANLKSA